MTADPMNDPTDSDGRCEALRRVLTLFPDATERPSSEDLIALAEWVATGSLSAATAIVGQTHALYARRQRTDE